MWSRKVMDHSANPHVSDSLLSVAPAEVAEPPRAEPEGRRHGLRLVLSVVIHAAVIAAAVIHFPEAEPVEAPEAIAVEIVQLPEMEPEPESHSEPEPEPQAEPEQQSETMQTARSSGASDNPELEADEAPRAEAEGEPTAPEPVEEASHSTELSPDLTGVLASYQEILAAMANQTFEIPTGNIESSGPGRGGGNPYLNAMRDRIATRIVYPGAQARGRAGTPSYRAVITRGGRLARVELVRSAGVDAIDQAGLDAIRASAPFDPLPSYIPGDSAIIDITLRIAP